MPDLCEEKLHFGKDNMAPFYWFFCFVSEPTAVKITVLSCLYIKVISVGGRTFFCL